MGNGLALRVTAQISGSGVKADGKNTFFGAVLFCTHITIKKTNVRGKTSKKGHFCKVFLRFLWPQLPVLMCHSPVVFNTVTFTCLPEEEERNCSEFVYWVKLCILFSCTFYTEAFERIPGARSKRHTKKKCVIVKNKKKPCSSSLLTGLECQDTC